MSADVVAPAPRSAWPYQVTAGDFTSRSHSENEIAGRRFGRMSPIPPRLTIAAAALPRGGGDETTVADTLYDTRRLGQNLFMNRVPLWTVALLLLVGATTAFAAKVPDFTFNTDKGPLSLQSLRGKVV